jgi:hypothetical protein
MRRTSTGSASAQNIGAGYVDVVTLAAPAFGSSLYRVVIKLTSLNTGHQLYARETQAPDAVESASYVANGTAKDHLVLEVALGSGDTSVVIAVKDASALSTSASWSYEVYEVFDGEPEVVEGTVVDAGATASDFDTSLTAAATNFYNNMACVFVTGALRGPPRRVTTSTTGTGNLAFATAWSAAPANGDKFILVGRIE